MEQLITEYLFGQKHCVLPGLGVLRISEKQAALLTPEKKIMAPVPFIEFYQKEEEARGMIRFVAAAHHLSEHHALSALTSFAQEVMQMPKGGEKRINGVGRFIMIGQGEVGFEQETLHPVFLPSVNAERVIRKDIAHQMLVGDRETTTVAMNEHLSQSRSLVKDLYWLWVVIISLLAALGILYFILEGGGSGLGNTKRIHPSDEPATYQSR